MTRRTFLEDYLGLGTLALSSLLTTDAAAASAVPNPLTPKPQHFPAKAKRCIFLFMEGGVSQVDTFDYKPDLQKYAGKTMPVPKGVEGSIASNLQAPHHVI